MLHLDCSIKAQLENRDVLHDPLYKGVWPEPHSLLQNFAADSLASCFSATYSPPIEVCVKGVPSGEQLLFSFRSATSSTAQDKAVFSTELAAWSWPRLQALSDTNKHQGCIA